MSSQAMNNNREYFRLELHNPLSSKLRIVKIHNNPVKTAHTEVLIDEIGPGGLRFLSNLNIPVNDNVIWEFETQILGHIIQIYGCIVRILEVEDGIHEYGVKFTVDETARLAMIKIFNELALKLRQSPLVKNCSFITMDKINFFKHLNQQERA